MSQPTTEAMRFKLAPEDQATYNAPDWYEFSVDMLSRKKASFCEEIEAEIGMSIPSFSNLLESQRTRGVRIMLWVGLKMAGIDVKFADFDPIVWGFEQAGGDPADPLAPTPTRRSTSRASRSKR